MNTPQAMQGLKAVGNTDAAGDLRRGQGMFNAATSVVRGMPTVARGAKHVANAILAPAGAVGAGALHLAGGVGSVISKSPLGMKILLAAGLLGPTLGSAAVSQGSANTQDMLDASNNPGGTMKLSSHFIKTSSTGTAAGMSMPKALFEGFGKGVGTTAGGGLVDALFSLGSSLGGRIHDSQVAGPQRERIFYEAMKSDPVLRDALRSNPAALGQMKEAFATLVRFAPSLAQDVNAVRSYLREAVISGGGINFATIKQLADTEKTVHERNTPRK